MGKRKQLKAPFFSQYSNFDCKKSYPAFNNQVFNPF